GKEMLIPRIKENIERRKGLNERHKIYLFGAPVWALVTYMHPDQVTHRRVSLRANGIQQFRSWAAETTPAAMRRRALDSVDEEQKEVLEKEIEKVEGIFFRTTAPDKLIAGAEILADLSDELNFDGKDLDFFRDGLYACIIGYIVKTSGMEK